MAAPAKTKTRTLLSRDWSLDIDVAYGASGSPSWKRYAGLTSIKETWDTNAEDTSSFDDDGYQSEAVTQRGLTIEVESKRRKLISTSYAPDPAQEVVRAAGREVGEAAVVHIRYYHSVTGEAYETFLSSQVDESGGSTTDLEPLNWSGKTEGRPTVITNPAA